MVEKPSLFNGNYDHLHGSESLLNYERDLMIWEQTEAIKELQRKLEEQDRQAKINSFSGVYSHTSSNLSSNEMSDIINFNVFEEGTPLYNKYNDLKARQNKLTHKIAVLGSDIDFFVWMFILALVLIGFPSLIVTENKDLRLFMSIATPIIVIIQIIITISLNEMKKEVQALEDEQKKLIEDNLDKNTHLPKKYKKRKTTKTKKHKNRE